MADTDSKQTYTQEEVTEILKRALRQQSVRGERLSHDELVQMASEIGIDRDSLEAASLDLAQTRADDLTHDDEARELAEERARSFNRFVSSLFTYVVVGVILYFVDLKATGGTWFYWPLMGFGVALAFQLRAVFFPQEGLERRRRRERKEQQRLERRATRDAFRRRLQAGFSGAPADVVSTGAKEFESAVQAGVAALLTVAARKIQAHAERETRPRRSEPRRQRT